MKKIIIIALLTFGTISCKKEKVLEPTTLIVEVKDENGDPMPLIYVTINTCTKIQDGSCHNYRQVTDAYANAKGKYVLENATPDLYYEIYVQDMGGGGLDSLYTFPGKLPANKKSRAVIKLE